MIFAHNLRTQRKAAHLSQSQLAERAGLHRTYVGGIEQGRINVSLKNIGKIAGALGVDPAELFREGDRPTPGNDDLAARLEQIHREVLSALSGRTAR